MHGRIITSAVELEETLPPQERSHEKEPKALGDLYLPF